MPRRRWIYNEATGETVEQEPPPEDTEREEREAEAARRQREQDEKDAHPGVYL